MNWRTWRHLANTIKRSAFALLSVCGLHLLLVQDTKILRVNVAPMTYVTYLPTTIRNLPYTVASKPMEMDSYIEPVHFQVSRLSALIYGANSI